MCRVWFDARQILSCCCAEKRDIWCLQQRIFCISQVACSETQITCVSLPDQACAVIGIIVITVLQSLNVKLGDAMIAKGLVDAQSEPSFPGIAQLDAGRLQHRDSQCNMIESYILSPGQKPITQVTTAQICFRCPTTETKGFSVVSQREQACAVQV